MKNPRTTFFALMGAVGLYLLHHYPTGSVGEIGSWLALSGIVGCGAASKDAANNR